MGNRSASPIVRQSEIASSVSDDGNFKISANVLLISLLGLLLGCGGGAKTQCLRVFGKLFFETGKGFNKSDGVRSLDVLFSLLLCWGSEAGVTF